MPLGARDGEWQRDPVSCLKEARAQRHLCSQSVDDTGMSMGWPSEQGPEDTEGGGHWSSAPEVEEESEMILLLLAGNGNRTEVA